MSAFRNLILFIAVSVIAFFVFAWYSGVFKGAEVEVKLIDPFVAVYHDNVGEYSETQKIQDSLYNLLWEDGIENYKKFGIFYDDPKTTDLKLLKSRVGCIIEKAYIEKAERHESKYRIYKFNGQRCAVVEIPYKNIFSVYAGIYKAYPLLNHYADEAGYHREPIIEIHDVPNKISFVMPLIKK